MNPYDAIGRHQQTIDSLSGAVLYRFAYNSSKLLEQITDGDGNVTRVERNADGSATTIVTPDKLRTVLALNRDGYLESITNPAKESYQFAYGTGGLLTAQTNPRNTTSEMTYDAMGRLTQDRDAADGFWELSRVKFRDGDEVRISSALNRTSVYRTRKLPDGSIEKTITEPDGARFKSTLTSGGKTEAIEADGTVWVTEEEADPRFTMQAPIVKRVTVKTPGGLTGIITNTRVTTLSKPGDLMSLATQTDTMTVNGNPFRTVYDAATRQYTTITPSNRQVVTRTDAQGRPVVEQVMGVLPVNYGYDSRGRLVTVTQGSGVEARVMRYAYNTEGYVESITDALSRVTRYRYDAAGRVVQVTLPNDSVVNFGYDANGNVTSVTPPGRPVHGFDYNAVDMATGYIPPALGDKPVATRYEYNLDKQLTKFIRPDGKTAEYGYDSNGRLATLTTPTGTINFGYMASSGQVASIAAPGDIGLAFSYDGSLLSDARFSGPVEGSVSTAYDNFFRVGEFGVNGSNIAYGYDSDGLLTSAGSLALTRDAGNGLVTGTTLEKISTSQTYDAFGQLAGVVATQGAAVLYEERYERDKVGRLIRKTVSIGGKMQVYGYGYDAAGRLTDVTLDGAPAGHFEYDANGNRTLAYGVAATYDAQDRLIEYGGAKYSYTQNGELEKLVAGSSTTDYEYDVFGNLKKVGLSNGNTLDYLIDGRNRRIGKKVNGTLVQGFLYQDQLKPAAELDASGNVVARFVYAGKANVPDYMVKGGSTYRIIADHLGSVRLVVNSATGEIVQRIDYDDWGNVLSDSNPGFQPFGFAGGLHDRDTGLVRFGAQDYAAQIGRWLTKDPIGFNGGDTSLYNYVGGDPVNFVDTNGLQVAVPASGSGAVVGGGIGNGTGYGGSKGGYDPVRDIFTPAPDRNFLPGWITDAIKQSSRPLAPLMRSEVLKNGGEEMAWTTRSIYFTKLKKEIAGSLVLGLQTTAQ